MSGRRLLTDAQIEEMAEMREAGKTYQAIGDHFGVAAKTIRWQCLRVGADSPSGHQIKPSSLPMVMMRAGRVFRRFTPDEDARLREMREAGAKTSSIARELGRKPNSVLGRLMTLAMHDARAEAQGAP